MNVHVNDIVGIVATPGGGGYFLVGKDGGVFTFGNAPFFGSLPGIGVSVNNIAGIASTPDGKGYYVVGANGAVYGFGDATSFGSLPGLGVTVSNIVSHRAHPRRRGLLAHRLGRRGLRLRRRHQPGVAPRGRGPGQQRGGGGADRLRVNGTRSNETEAQPSSLVAGKYPGKADFANVCVVVREWPQRGRVTQTGIAQSVGARAALIKR